MTELVSVRIPDNLTTTIRELARREQLDESTTIRQRLSRGIREYACDLYREGEVSVREAASIAEVPLREMIDILEERGIKGNVTLEQQRKAIENALDLGEEASGEG